MAIEIDNLQIRIQANADNAASAIERLKNALASLKSAVGTKGISGLNKLAENINNVGIAIAGIDIERLERFRDVVRDLKGTTKIRVDMSKGTEKLIKANEDEYIRRIRGEGDGTTTPSDPGQSDLPEKTEETTSFGDAVKKAASSMGLFNREGKGFFATVKRIAKLMLIRAAIRAFISGLKEGIANLKAWSAETNQRFAKSMESASASLTNFKNSLAVIAAPLINWFIPYMRLATIRIMEFANALANMFAMLTGATTYDAVIEGVENVEAIGDAAGKSKQKLRDLLGFDEINRLSGPSGGGGGGGASSQDWSGMFEERETNIGKAKETLDDILQILALISGLTIWKWLPKLAKWLSALKPAFTILKDALGAVEHISIIVALIFSVVEALISHWDQWVEAVRNSLERLGLYDRIKNLFDMFSSWLSAAFNMVKTVVGAIADIVGSVIISGVIATLIAAINSIVGFVETIWDGVRTIILSFVNFFKTEFEAITLFLKGDFKGGIKTAWEGIQTWFSQFFIGFGKVLLSPFVGVVEFVRGMGVTIAEIWKSLTKNVKEWVNEYLIRPLNKVIDALNNMFGLNLSRIKEWVTRNTPGNGGGGSGNGNSYYQEYASGGYPTTGQMFIAREAGPELVGSIGGRTAVATNNDIVAAVSQGVASAVASVMGGNSGQSIAVNVDGRNLFNIMVNQNNAYVRQTGASPLLV